MTNNNFFSDFPNISWIDVETNGLDNQKNSLFEVACIVTDRNLNILDEEGYSATIYYPKQEISILRDQTDPYVVEMHERTGLWDRLLTGKPMEVVDSQLHEYMSQFTSPHDSWLGGNSITLDRNFLQVNLPNSFNHLHHRSIDVTSVNALARAWFGITYEKKTLHTAFSDITESIEELRFYKENIFKKH